MSELDRAIGEASQLSLRDAAHHLWRRRYEFGPPEGDQEKPAPAGNLANLQADFTSGLRPERTAPWGPTFARLKRAHPEADDDSLKKAVFAAMKLSEDCARFFSDDVTRAVERAKQENPGFSEETYGAAWLELAKDIR
jgi:hypothetical protein